MRKYLIPATLVAALAIPASAARAADANAPKGLTDHAEALRSEVRKAQDALEKGIKDDKTSEAIAAYTKAMDALEAKFVTTRTAELAAWRKVEKKDRIMVEVPGVGKFDARKDQTKDANYYAPASGWVYDAFDWGEISARGSRQTGGPSLHDGGTRVHIWLKATSEKGTRERSWLEVQPTVKWRLADPGAQARGEWKQVKNLVSK